MMYIGLLLVALVGSKAAANPIRGSSSEPDADVQTTSGLCETRLDQIFKIQQNFNQGGRLCQAPSLADAADSLDLDIQDVIAACNCINLGLQKRDAAPASQATTKKTVKTTSRARTSTKRRSTVKKTSTKKKTTTKRSSGKRTSTKRTSTEKSTKKATGKTSSKKTSARKSTTKKNTSKTTTKKSTRKTTSSTVSSAGRNQNNAGGVVVRTTPVRVATQQSSAVIAPTTTLPSAVSVASPSLQSSSASSSSSSVPALLSSQSLSSPLPTSAAAQLPSLSTVVISTLVASGSGSGSSVSVPSSAVTQVMEIVLPPIPQNLPTTLPVVATPVVPIPVISSPSASATGGDMALPVVPVITAAPQLVNSLLGLGDSGAGAGGNTSQAGPGGLVGVVSKVLIG